MKAELIANIITAHYSGSESQFKQAVELLAADEEKKGNTHISGILRNAYNGKTTTLISKPEVHAPHAANGSFATQSAGGMYAPRDKDSMLELYDIVESNVSLDDVVLPHNQRDLIRQMLDERKNNEKLSQHNLPLANRLLLCGPPGCGKTMTAYAITHELNLPMAYVRIDGLVSSYLGQTSVNLRKVFSSLSNREIVLFLDEFDAIAKKRDDGHELGELKRVVTALLQNFDNMPDSIFLVAATNHEHLLDPAIWRRFNYTIHIGYPDAEQRKLLIERWLKEYGVKSKIKLQKLTDLTADRSVAQIKELIIAAAKRHVTSGEPITMEDMVELLIHQLTNNSNGVGVIDLVVPLHKKGVSVRTLAKVLGMPHNTLSYQINKVLENDKETD